MYDEVVFIDEDKVYSDVGNSQTSSRKFRSVRRSSNWFLCDEDKVYMDVENSQSRSRNWTEVYDESGDHDRDKILTYPQFLHTTSMDTHNGIKILDLSFTNIYEVYLFKNFCFKDTWQ